MVTLRYNSPDNSVSQRSNGSLRANGQLQKCTVANSVAQKSEVTGLSGAAKKTKGSNGQQLQTLTGALTWRTPDSEQ
jgi:hypothetical protein